MGGTVDDRSVISANTAPPPNELPPDLATIRRGATRVIEICTLPRYEDVLQHVTELEGYMRVMIPAVESLVPRVDDDFALNTIKGTLAEARHTLETPLGNGLKSAMDYAKSLGHVLVILCHTYVAFEATFPKTPVSTRDMAW